MADERDPGISRKYRELGAEEPPRALDEAILAASRRAVSDEMRNEMRSRPAPLVVPAGRRRWYFPVAAAAVIMLTVAVTVQMERQKPDGEIVVASAPPQAKEERAAGQVEKKEQASSGPAAEQPRPAQKAMRAPQPFTPDPAVAAQPAPPPQAAPSPNTDALRDLAKSNEPVAAQGSRAAEAPPQADESVRGQAQRRSDVTETRRMERGPAAAMPSQSKPAPPVANSAAIAAAIAAGPERWLEDIIELRRLGMHEAADRSLVEFRKAFPDYRLSDEMRAKVEKK